ncbi:hypothetical protein NQ315_014169 [Exocentrus adspersus]|uniref:Uncharacterized protein n=1 Tax=Exocentrus adspersus TaxID=1586481 RepID=A0AAV8VW97_9CUCU|nr:hypothetical protein NQ315_014169 [Exocentrus adspersus]
MRRLIFLTTVFSLSFGIEKIDVTSPNIGSLQFGFDLDENLVNQFFNRYEESDKNLEDLTVIVNEYADKVFQNIGHLAVKNQLDPLGLSDVDEKFTYDYHVIILLIGPKGTVLGKLKDFKMDVRLVFDFETYHATVQSIETTNKGHVSITIHGNAIIDVVVNTLSEFATAVLQPLISSKIENIVTEVVNRVVAALNDVIDGFLSPTTTSSLLLIQN